MIYLSKKCNLNYQTDISVQNFKPKFLKCVTNLSLWVGTRLRIALRFYLLGNTMASVFCMCSARTKTNSNAANFGT